MSCRIFKQNEAKTRVAWGRLVTHWQNLTSNTQMESEFLYMIYAFQFSSCLGLKLSWSSEAGNIFHTINIVQFGRPLNCPSSMLNRWPPKGFQRYQILNLNHMAIKDRLTKLLGHLLVWPPPCPIVSFLVFLRLALYKITTPQCAYHGKTCVASALSYCVLLSLPSSCFV